MLQENGIRDLVSDLISSKPSFTSAPTEDWKDGDKMLWAVMARVQSLVGK